MRLTSRSLLLALAATGVQSFTPPSGRVSSRSIGQWVQPSSLSAGSTNELSGLLSEYNSGASTQAAASSLAPTVSEAGSVSSPSTNILASPDVETNVRQLTDALNDATDVASDAADQAAKAAAAAMATMSKTAAATKAATAAATASSVQTLPGGIQVLPGGFQFRPPKESLEITNKVSNNLSTLKANFMSGVDSASDSAPLSTDFDIKSLSASPIIPAFVDSLHLKEYGGWYVAAAMAIIASQQRSAGRKEASIEFESELQLAREKASQAASAAGLAAEGAKMAKSLAMKMEKSSGQDPTKAILERSRMEALQAEKDLMGTEIESLTKKVASLQSQLNAFKSTQTSTSEPSSFKSEIEIAYPNKITMERDPDEDARMIEILKEMDEENIAKKALAREELEKKRETESQYVASQKAKEAEAEAAALAEKIAKEEAKKAKAEAKKEAAAAKAAAEKAEADKMAREVEEAQAIAEAKIKSASKGAESSPPTTKKATRKTKSSEKAKSKSSAKKSKKTTVSDWQSLSDATLKRKTVAEITAYLSDKGVRVTDESGKVYKKADLVAAVKSL